MTAPPEPEGGAAGAAPGVGGATPGLGGATGADLPGASERTRLGELYGEMPDAPEPLVRVVRGEPDALELAALIAGLTAAASVAVDIEEQEVTRHRWADRSHALRGGTRGLPARGASAWRWSLHP